MNFAILLTSAVALVSLCSPACAATNLIVNGNFESGNAGFSSSYIYTPGINTGAGQYTLSTNPSLWNSLAIPAGDHTTGTGKMFVANGSPTDGAVVWQSGVIAVSQSTIYLFDAWVMNICCIAPYNNPADSSPAILEFSINGVTVGTNTTNLTLAGTWEGLSTSWNSGDSTTAVLRLINRNTALYGNDFSVDDISLSAVPEQTSLMLILVGLFFVLPATLRKKRFC